MLNGDGLRVVLFVSGCSHHCSGCHNPETWNANNGQPFTYGDLAAIWHELQKDYISGITFSGGDPLHPNNREVIGGMANFIKKFLPEKTIWLYTGYTYEVLLETESVRKNVLPYIDVLVDGKFIPELADVKYPWAGSTNQRVIDVRASLKQNKIILHQ